MICRYCGMELKSINQRLFSKYGEKCKASQNGKHLAVSTGDVCVYCGETAKAVGQVLRTKYGDRCPASPTGRHALQ